MVNLVYDNNIEMLMLMLMQGLIALYGERGDMNATPLVELILPRLFMDSLSHKEKHGDRPATKLCKDKMVDQIDAKLGLAKASGQFEQEEAGLGKA